MAKIKVDIGRVDEIIMQHIHESMREKANIISKSKGGVSAKYDENTMSFSVTFEKGLDKDIEQDKIKLLLKGGVAFNEKKDKKDMYIIPPMGEKL